MQNHAVAHRHIVLDDERVLILHDVQNRTVLNIAARPDANPMHVAANHGAGPDAGVLANRDVADDYGRRVDVSRRGDLRPAAVIAADHFLTSTLPCAPVVSMRLNAIQDQARAPPVRAAPT